MGKKNQLRDYSLISGQGTNKDANKNIIDIRDQFVDRSNTLEFHKNSGDVVYIDKSNKKRQGHFGLRDNGYLLLSFLVEHPGKSFTPKELAEHLNKAREYSESTDDRRIRDTIQSIRKELNLIKDKTNDFFIVDKGFGIRCKVEIRL